MDKVPSAMKDLTAAAQRKFKALAMSTRAQVHQMLLNRVSLRIDVDAYVRNTTFFLSCLLTCSNKLQGTTHCLAC